MSDYLPLLNQLSNDLQHLANQYPRSAHGIFATLQRTLATERDRYLASLPVLHQYVQPSLLDHIISDQGAGSSEPGV